MVNARRATWIAPLLGTLAVCGGCLSIVGADKDYRQADEAGSTSASGGGDGASSGNGGAECGNATKDAEEECDGSDFGQATCASTVGAVSTGTLVCRNDCTIDPGDCSDCGNGTIENEEACDGDDFGAAKCTDVVGEPAGGSLSCNSTCEIVSSACKPCGLENFTVVCTPEWSCPQNSICAGNPPGTLCNCNAGFTATTCDGRVCDGDLCMNTVEWYCQ